MADVKFYVMKDSDGDYWLQYGLGEKTMACLMINAGQPYMTAPDMTLADVNDAFGPLTRVEIVVTEAPDVTKTCDACLRDLHFCFQCDDSVGHYHVHTEG